MEWWQQMMVPVRRVWVSVANRLHLRKSGLFKLQHDVRACEYEDIRVMWEILKRNETEFAQSVSRSKKRHYYKLFK